VEEKAINSIHATDVEIAPKYTMEIVHNLPPVDSVTSIKLEEGHRDISPKPADSCSKP
jgi:hypothetical protein